MSHQHLENAVREVPEHLMSIIMHYVTGFQNISAREISEPIVNPAIIYNSNASCDNLFLLSDKTSLTTILHSFHHTVRNFGCWRHCVECLYYLLHYSIQIVGNLEATCYNVN